MKDQDTLWNTYEISQSSSSGESISGISLGDEGVLYTDANDLQALERERGKALCQTVCLAQRRLLGGCKQFFNNGAITACLAYY